MDQTKNIERLLDIYMSGAATPEQAQEVEAWAASSPGNQAVLEKRFAAAGWHAPQHRPLRVEQPRPKNRRGVLIAAAAVVLLALGYWWLQPPSTPAAPLTQGRNLLPDGSVAFVAAGAQAKQSATYGHTHRELWLQGSGYFDVQPNAAKPFVVYAGPYTVTVTGTSFLLHYSGDTLRVNMRTGSLRVACGKRSWLVQAGQSLLWFNGRLLQSGEIPFNEFFPYSEELRFTDTPLAEIIPVLEKAYNLRIHATPSLLGRKISTRFSGRDAGTMLTVLASTMDISYEVNHGTVELYEED